MNDLKQIQSRLTRLEQRSRFDAESQRAFNEIQVEVLDWLAKTEAAPLAMRFGRLARRVRGTADQREFLLKARRYFTEPVIDFALSTLLIEEGDFPEAKKTLLTMTENSNLKPEQFAKAARLLAKMTFSAEAVITFQKAASIDQRYYGELIFTLLGVGDRLQALEIAQECVSQPIDRLPVLFASYNAFVGASARQEEIAKLRARILQTAEAVNELSYWEARLFRFERNYDAAILKFAAALVERPTDIKILKEQIGTMIQSGEWGRHAPQILAGKGLFQGDSELLDKIQVVEAFVETFSRNGNSSNAQRAELRHARTPDVVFEHVAGAAQLLIPRRGPKRLVMIGGTLGPGGAERVFATLARRLADTQQFEAIKLYFLDLNPKQRKDFYLPHLQFAETDLIVLDRNCQTETPVKFLPIGHAKMTQAVLNRIRQDQPDILYAALEPLTVFSALAGLLGGVPKIVMHSHNMPPAELHPDSNFPDRLRECYRVLLRKPHISLVTCAKAASESYREWLDCAAGANILHLHNGLDFDRFTACSTDERQSLRATLCARPMDILIGTAFAFRQEKQPFLWVDAAERIASARPECRFVMFGDGILLEPTKAYVAAKGLKDRFAFPGLVSDLHGHLPSLDLFMLSSRSEALPNVLIEAQAAGVPVITTPVGGVRETFLEGETGFVSENSSSSELANTALKALEDPDWLQQAASRAPGFVRAQFSVERMVQSFIDLLEF